jgi:hypothetical protein
MLALHAHSGLALVFALCLAACVDASWPFHRHETAAAASSASGDGNSESECSDIRSQIRASEEQRREAPVTSTDPEIVSASLGKADKRIDDLRTRYAELDCPPERMPQPGRVPPLQPAPAPPPH